MPCLKPLTGYMPPHGGRAKLKKPKNAEGLKTVQFACGECLNCLNRRSMDWAVRQYHESILVPQNTENLFATFTWSDENIPSFGLVDYRPFQLMNKKLRKVVPGKYTFVAVPEYGENTFRPHIHANFFGINLPDLEQAGKNNRGSTVLRSKILEKAWGQGLVDLQPFGFGAAMYVGRHNMKQTGEHVKLSLRQRYHQIRKQAEQTAYEQTGIKLPVDPDTGELYPEKITLPRIRASKRPGIGATFYEKYKEDLFGKGFCTVDGKKFPVPKYYETQLLREDPQRWLNHIVKRKDDAREFTTEELAKMEKAKLHKRQFFAKEKIL